MRRGVSWVLAGCGLALLVSTDALAQPARTTRASIATDGSEGNGESLSPSLSSNGRHVAFNSVASNLVADDTNGVRDVFVRDRDAGTTARVSVASGGQQGNAVAGDTNGAYEVFRHNRLSGATTRVSVGPAGAQAAASSFDPAISADGRHAAFASYSGDLVSGDTNYATDVFVRDRGGPVPPCDFDGDAATDATVFRPSSGVWYEVRRGTGAGYAVSWGIGGDVPVPGDYDGDGESDAAVFRPSTGVWYVLQSTTGTGVGVRWGVSDDIPVPADYDGDGKADVAVWRPSTGVWYIIRSATNTAVGVTWGTTGDTPVPADFDGDGKADPTVFRASAGTWYELRSTTGAGYGVLWGTVGDMPLAGDYDGDGKADPTVFRASSGMWFELRSTTGVGFGVTWGTADDVPIVGDYDGDGKMDPTVFRPSTSTWYQLRSTTGVGYGLVWGMWGDLPTSITIVPVQGSVAISGPTWVIRGIVVYFTATVTPSTLRVNSYEFAMGDGSVYLRNSRATSETIAHQYQQPGQYAVTVRVTTALGETLTAQTAITVTYN